MWTTGQHERQRAALLRDLRKRGAGWTPLARILEAEVRADDRAVAELEPPPAEPKPGRERDH